MRRKSTIRKDDAKRKRQEKKAQRKRTRPDRVAAGEKTSISSAPETTGERR